MAVDGLRRAVELCREMLDNKDLAVSVKLKWTHALAQTAGVLLRALRDAGVVMLEEDEGPSLEEMIVALSNETGVDLRGVPKKLWRCRVDRVKKVLDRCASRWGKLSDACPRR